MNHLKSKSALLGGLVIAAGALLALMFLRVGPEAPTSPGHAGTVRVGDAKPAQASVANARGANGAMLRPLAVSKKTAIHEWTSEDATDPKVIEKIALNPDQFIQMVEENARIKRRQLVYRSETLPQLLEKIRGSGEPLKTFTLPGIDGRELEIEVTEVQENSSLHGGTVTGHVKGHFNSMVSVGFVNGYESYNVVSPEENLFLVADARQPGEVIVKEIDPSQYAPPSQDDSDFILTEKPRRH